ncbi:hypothetical protein HMPREF9520_02109 [Enterococcus faecalis TX1467]|nr:hypothetical protein HMPREF9520_02109 [Enterococcus faecalis TX1467]
MANHQKTNNWFRFAQLAFNVLYSFPLCVLSNYAKSLQVYKKIRKLNFTSCQREH